MTQKNSIEAQDKKSEQKFYNDLFRKRKRFDQFQVAIYEDVALQARKVTQGKIALDLGCGSGTQTICLRAQGFEVMSADLSFEATKVSKTTLEQSNQKALVVNADAEFLPFPDASVDACVCSLFLHHFTNLDGVAAELKRIVRPGGVVVATDANAHNPFAFLFFNVVHRIYPLPGLTQNQRALRRHEIQESFEKFGFGGFHFDSFSTDLRRDWLGESFAYTLNFYSRAFLLWLSKLILPRLAQGNGLLSVCRRLPDSGRVGAAK